MGKERLQSYVEFFYPGLLFVESFTKRARSRDPSRVRAPESSFGYRFFDRLEYKAANGRTLVGDPTNYSGMHYFGRVMTSDDVRREISDEVKRENLLYNMRGSGKVVRTRHGNFQPFKKGDVVITEKQDSKSHKRIN